MRQLRLYKDDQKFQIMTSSGMHKETQIQIKEYITVNKQKIDMYTFENDPIQIKIKDQIFLLGLVPCEKMKIIQLPETGDLCVFPCEGGFYIAAEYKK